MTLAGLFILFFVASLIWVWSDASRRDWTNGKFVTDSAAAWVLGCVLLWIIVFPVYLAQRNRAPFKTS